MRAAAAAGRSIGVAIVVAGTLIGSPASSAGADALAPTDVVPAGTTTLLDDNAGGAWSWFEDERAIVDTTGTRMYTTVDTGVESIGTVRMLELDLATGSRRIVDLGRAEVDDHNTAALWQAPNGDILASWARHAKDDLLRQYRRTTDGTWIAQPPVVAPGEITYDNLYSLNGGALLYEFSRSTGKDPYVQTSTDGGHTWTFRGRLLRDPEDSTNRWPYLKYTSNGTDRIDFMATPSHPRQTATEIYAGYIKNDTVYTSDGTALGPVGSSIDVTRLTLVWAPPNELEDGWDVDIAEDPATDTPVLMFVRNINFGDNRYYYARWSASGWDVDEIAYGGTSFYSAEPDYSGLAAIDPAAVGTVVISTDADPDTGQPLISAADGQRHRELYQGSRQVNGHFTWTPLTSNSSVDNIRPIWTASPSGADAMLWLRGHYSAFTSFRMALVGVVHRAGGTTVAAGAVTPTVPSADATVFAGNFDLHATGDLLLHRASGPEELRLFDPAGAISRVPLPPGHAGATPVVGDFTGDKQSDIYWYAPGATTDHLWTQNTSAFVDSIPAQVRGVYQPLVGDFDGNGSDDIYWYAPGSARDSMWLSSAGQFRSVSTAQVSGQYTPVVGDFDGNGSDDIFWYAPGTATDTIWFSRSGVFTLAVRKKVDGAYTPVAGDFDGRDGSDIYWYSPSGTDRLWLSTNTRDLRDVPVRQMGPLPSGGSDPVATDLDGNGSDDLVWFVGGAGADEIWHSSAAPFDVVTTATL